MIKMIVEKACKDISDCPLIAVPQIKLTSRQGILSFYQRIVNRGGEGLVLTNPDSKYSTSGSRSSERVTIPSDN